MLADLHTHSLCSDDGRDSMTDMAKAAFDSGIGCLCLTDHCDIEHYTTGLYDPNCFKPALLTRSFDEALRLYCDKIDLRLGIELGAANHYPERASEIAMALDFDFIICSVHNLKDSPDFYLLSAGECSNPDDCRYILERYTDEHFDFLHRYTDFDVLGHLGYPLRYMKRFGFESAFDGFTDCYAGLFKQLIECGKGIEANSYGLRTDFGSILPPYELLRLYRELGGDIITVGSDAHCASDVGQGIAETTDLLRSLGFKYYTTFRKRKPEFIPL